MVWYQGTVPPEPGSSFPPEAYSKERVIDIHSHILPGVDDGAETIEQAVEMVRMAAENGTTDIVATPHANTEFPFDPETVERKASELAAACGGALRIHTGCDFHLTVDNIQDALSNPGKYTINRGRYLLVELSDRLVPTTTDEVFRRMLAAGIIPVVTHPERNRRLHRRLDRVEKWVAEGSCVQITGDSLSGRFGKTARAVATELMERGLVHFVASDAHGTRDRKPVLKAAFEQVAEAYGEDYARLLFCDNPKAAIEAAPVLAAKAEPAPGRKWYQFWRRPARQAKTS